MIDTENWRYNKDCKVHLSFHYVSPVPVISFAHACKIFKILPLSNNLNYDEFFSLSQIYTKISTTEICEKNVGNMDKDIYRHCKHYYCATEYHLPQEDPRKRLTSAEARDTQILLLSSNVGHWSEKCK